MSNWHLEKSTLWIKIGKDKKDSTAQVGYGMKSVGIAEQRNY